MFKDENKTWLYLIGIIIMFGILVTIAVQYIVPTIWGRNSIVEGTLLEKPELILQDNVDYSIKITTNFGDLDIDIYEKNAPENVNNFIFLVRENIYTNTLFYHLTPDLLIQGGSTNAKVGDTNTKDDIFGRTKYSIEDEVNWESLNLSDIQKNKLAELGYKSNESVVSEPIRQGSLVMANTVANSNSTQFFIVLASSNDLRIQQLQGRYTVIGGITSGISTLQTFQNFETEFKDSVQRPIENIVIEKIEIFENPIE